jgi:hypothetical protein
MKALIPLLLVSTSALAVTTVQFAHRASAERQRAEQALALSQKHEARIHELEKERSALDRELMEAQRPAVADVPTTAPPTEMATVLQRIGPPPVATRLATLRADAVVGNGATFGIQPWAPAKQSPAAQRYWQWQRKASTRRLYEGVGSALGLSSEQENKLMDVLTNQQVSALTSAFRQPPDGATGLRDLKKRTEAEVAAVIGEDKLPQWHEYQQTIPERVRVNMVGEQMRQLDVPLSDEQRSRLVDIMVDQAQQNPRPMPQEGLPPDETIKASMKWEEESDQAFLERAKSVLTSDQYERYRDYQAWQSEMRANSLRYMQTNGENGSMVSFMRTPIPADPPK